MTDAAMTAADVARRARWTVATWVHAQRLLRRWSRSVPIVAQAVAVPVGMLLLIRLMFGGVLEQATGQVPITSLTMVVVCAGIMMGGIGAAAALVGERSLGITDRIATAPPRPSSLYAGRLAAEVVRSWITTAALLCVGAALGVRVHAGIVGVAAVFVFASVIAVGFGAVMIVLGTVAATPETTIVAMPLVMLMMFLNTGFIPLDLYPGYLQPVVTVLPMTSAVEAMSGALEGSWHAADAAALLSWCVGAAVFGFIALRRWRGR